MKIPIPSKSVEAFNWLINDKKVRRNPGLIFDRFSPDLSIESDSAKLKQDTLNLVYSSANNFTDPSLLKEWNSRWERLVRAVGAEPFVLKTDWRLIAGLGRKGSLEVGFTFHRYGFPYLPGSSIKGLSRAYGLLEIASLLGRDKLSSLRKTVSENNHKKPDDIGLLDALDTALSREEKKDFETELQSSNPTIDTMQMAGAFRFIFGTTQTAGKAIFFDAIPSAMPRLELDIINPHYPDYYKEMGSDNPRAYPTNWQSPIPVQFLTVSPGTGFRFAIGWRNSPADIGSDTEKNQQPQTWSWFKGEKVKHQTAPADHPRMQKLARRWLQGGLLELGAGGKTNAGYGYFVE